MTTLHCYISRARFGWWRADRPHPAACRCGVLHLHRTHTEGSEG